MNQLFEGRGQTLSSFIADNIIALKLKRKKKKKKKLKYEKIRKWSIFVKCFSRFKVIKFLNFIYFKEK
jgi:hypothetical protein